MNYRINPKNGDELSILGLGCMRFPKDEAETERMILRAIERGINYFDTAYVYGGSEVTLGRILARNDKRGAVKLATKLPPYLVKKYADLDKILNTQLERLKTDFIDYYFIHMITDLQMWRRLTDMGIEEWIARKKSEGVIRNIGFSYHGGRDEYIRILDAYAWEFTMIQYNYLDEHNQAGKNGLLAASAKGLPVMIMEPLRGGKLAANLPKGAQRAFSEAEHKRSAAEWALRWLWDQPEVTCVLSGMSSEGMLLENLAAADTAQAGEFTEAEREVVARAKKAFEETIKVPCTGCNYCMPCPQGVDIPTCLSCYNNTVIEGKNAAVMKYIMQTSLKAKPQTASLCNGCGACEKRCPQKIGIRDELKKAKKALEKFYFKPMTAVARRFMRLK